MNWKELAPEPREAGKGESIITSFSANDEKTGKAQNDPAHTSAGHNAGQRSATAMDDAAAAPAMSLKQPVWHVVVLGVTTFSTYQLFWAYKNWRDLATHFKSRAGGSSIESGSRAESDSHEDSDSLAKSAPFARLLPEHLAQFSDSSPGLRTVWLLVPYLNNYILFTLYLGIARLQPDKSAFSGAHPVLAALLLTAAAAAFFNLCRLPGALFLLFVLAMLPAAVAQHWLNSYWDSVEKPGLLVRHGFSFMELAGIIIGGLSLGFICTGFILGINK